MTHRPLATSLAACSVVMLALLANHPQGGGHAPVEVLAAEARDQLIDGWVHGGAILVLSALIVCFVLLSRVLGPARVSVTAGLISFCIGCGAMMASLLLDGLAVPAIATRFIKADAEGLRQAETLIIFCGILIRYLMPLALFFQAVAMLCWSAAILARRRAVGAVGVAAAIVLIAALGSTFPRPPAHVVLGGLVLLSLWYLALAGLLWSGEPLSQHD
jgi:hypothetical protein